MDPCLIRKKKNMSDNDKSGRNLDFKRQKEGKLAKGRWQHDGNTHLGRWRDEMYLGYEE